MIRCIKLFSGKDGKSYFTEGQLDLQEGERGDFISSVVGATSISFRETGQGGSFSWHTAPAHQFVLTLSGTLDFEMPDGTKVRIYPGDVLWADDTVGQGHRWHLVDEQPWRRAYVIFAKGASIPFVAAQTSV